MEKNTITYTVNIYNTENEIVESYDYKSRQDATDHMSRIEEAAHLYPDVTTELQYN